MPYDKWDPDASLENPEVYSQYAENATWMKPNEARARKWALVTGYGHNEHPFNVEKKIAESMNSPMAGRLCRLGLEIQLENHIEGLTKHPSLSHIGTRLRTMMPATIHEAVTSSAVEPFVKTSIALVRRTYVMQFAKSLVTMWPMRTPEERVFYLNFLKGSNKLPSLAGQRLDLLENLDPSYAGWGGFSAVWQATANQTRFSLKTAGVVNPTDLKVTVEGVTKTYNLDYTFSAGTGSQGTDEIIFGSGISEDVVVAIYNISTYREGDTPRDVDFDMGSKIIKVRDTALRGGWTRQLEQDLGAYHALDAEPEITAALAGEIDAELDHNVVMFLLAKSLESGAGNVNWSQSGYLPGDTNSASRRAYELTLGDTLETAGNLIWKLNNGRINWTWAVMGSNASLAFQKLSNFKAVTGDFGQSGILGGNTMSIERRTAFGTIDGTKTVYKDPRFPSNRIMLGFKSDNPMFMSAVLGTYLQMYFTDVLDDPTANFKRKKGVLNRSAIETINDGQTATITLVP